MKLGIILCLVFVSITALGQRRYRRSSESIKDQFITIDGRKYKKETIEKEYGKSLGPGPEKTSFLM